MLLPSETMLLLFVISYTFVLDARVLSMNRFCTLNLHNKYSHTNVKLMLNFKLTVYEQRSERGKMKNEWFSRLFRTLPGIPEESDSLQLDCFRIKGSTDFSPVGKVRAKT